MKTKSKSLLIAVAAFAVTTTGTLAYDDFVLKNSGLTDEQIAALQEARDLRQSGDKDAARDLLAEAGIGEEELRSLHQAAHEERNERREAIDEAIENDDFDAFLEAIADSPLADIITTEDDFDTFKEAHQLRRAGNKEEARELLNGLGIERDHDHGHRHGMMHALSELSEEERDAFMVAKRANDKETMKAILEEAGVEQPDFMRSHGHQ